jgi:hypothetical protein
MFLKGECHGSLTFEWPAGRSLRKRRRMGTSRAGVFIVSALVTALATGQPVGAQRPERPQDVRVPGPGVLLKIGWQSHVYDGCRLVSPASWHEAADGGSMVAPDGSSLSVRTYRIKSWSDHKGQIKAAFGRVNVVHEDSDRRLWFEIGDPPRVQHYIDVNNGTTVCTGLLEIRTATTLTAEDVNRIADSIGPAPVP